MKVKEQTRKLAAGSTWVRQGETDVVWRDFRRVWQRKKRTRLASYHES